MSQRDEGDGFDMSGIEEAIRRLSEAAYDAAGRQETVAEAARKAAGSVNGVAWWKESLARFAQQEGHVIALPARPKAKA